MEFNVPEMKVVRAHISQLIATSAEELAEMTNTKFILSNAAGGARLRRGHDSALTPDAEKAECLRLYAEVEAEMGRNWMKKHDLQNV
ncbi:hypothetical protein Sste5346_003937 [Sporothrix stenoceras]|uniref:Uncharacterized protein n=1 Tax=Sporothrix stenoceras TaxID=5173 RepID=A0ABR3ZAF3_9PEZI